MGEKPKSGSLFGIPYNFDRPKLGRMLSAYWKPGESMLVEKPFGVGYTLNLANWRSWLVVGLVGALLWQERSKDTSEGEVGDEDAEPVEVLVED